MKNIMEYKGYLGSVEFSEEDEMFFGRVLGIHSLISYEGDNAKDLIADFHNSVDEYLKWCEDEGRKPEKAYKGSFNIRISPKLHRNIHIIFFICPYLLSFKFIIAIKCLFSINFHCNLFSL